MGAAKGGAATPINSAHGASHRVLTDRKQPTWPRTYLMVTSVHGEDRVRGARATRTRSACCPALLCHSRNALMECEHPTCPRARVPQSVLSGMTEAQLRRTVSNLTVGLAPEGLKKTEALEPQVGGRGEGGQQFGNLATRCTGAARGG